MKLQYLSDLYLGASNVGFHLDATQVKAPYLVLAGGNVDVDDDGSIREYAAFLRSCADLFVSVFVVIGGTLSGARVEESKIIRELPEPQRARVIVLERNTHDINDDASGITLRILGCTLDTMDKRERDDDLRWLRQCLQDAAVTKTPCLVVTHYAPLCRQRRLADDEVSSTETADVLELVTMPAVAAWIHGHTRHNHVSQIERRRVCIRNDDDIIKRNEENSATSNYHVLLLSNQRGVPIMNSFTPIAVVDFSS